MDGRVQLPVNAYLRERFGVAYVDTVTEAGPVAALTGPADAAAVRGIHERVMLSLERHGSRGLAVAAHHDCAGNAVPPERQQEQLRACLRLLGERFPAIPIVALWVDEHWRVHEIA